MNRSFTTLGFALVFLTVAAPITPAQSKADQAAFDARLGNAHFSLDGENYLLIYKDGAPTRIDFDEVGGFNWFNQNGEYFADVKLMHNSPKKGEQLKQARLEDALEIGLETAGPTADVRYIPGLLGDPPNRVMYYQTPKGEGYSGEYYMLQITHEEDSGVTQVLELTDTNLKLKFKGTGTLGERRDRTETPAEYEAVIDLKRTPFVKLPPSQVFGETCDPTLYDRIAGAEYRSPTDCEIKFERHVGHVFVDAVKATTDEFEKMGWVIFKQSNAEPRGVGLARNQKRYQMNLGAASPLELQRRSNEDEAAYRDQRREEVLAKYAIDRQIKELMAMQTDIKGNDEIHISVAINFPPVVADSISYMKPLTSYPVTGGGLAFSTNDTDDNAEQVKLSPNMTVLYLGPVKQTTAKNSDGSSTMRIQPTFDPKAPTLAVQDVKITIECKPELAAQVLAKLGVQKLQGLVYKGSN
jgi:hypothetical protein